MIMQDARAALVARESDDVSSVCAAAGANLASIILEEHRARGGSGRAGGKNNRGRPRGQRGAGGKEKHAPHAFAATCLPSASAVVTTPETSLGLSGTMIMFAVFAIVLREAMYFSAMFWTMACSPPAAVSASETALRPSARPSAKLSGERPQRHASSRRRASASARIRNAFPPRGVGPGRASFRSNTAVWHSWPRAGRLGHEGLGRRHRAGRQRLRQRVVHRSR